MPDWLPPLVVSYSFALFWLTYFYYTGRYRHCDDALLIVAFFAGMVAAPLSLALFELLERVPFYRQLGSIWEIHDDAKLFAYSLAAIGPVEELSKFVVIWAVLFRRPEFRHPMDGLVFAAAGALGFACVENWYYMREAGEVVWARAITQPFNHMLFSSFWGVGLSAVRFRPRRGGRWVLYAGLVLAAVYHGFYDYVLLSPNTPKFVVLPLVALLWVWLVVALRRLRNRKLVGLTGDASIIATPQPPAEPCADPRRQSP